jgi:hypothetical protein
MPSGSLKLCGSWAANGFAAVIALLILTCTSLANSISGSSSHRVKITFSGYSQPETLSDFPALVILNTNMSQFSYTQFAAPATGGDLRFTDAGGTELYFEIERWDTNTLESISPTNIAGCVLWLRADSGVQTNGSAVTGWLDQSGKGNNAPQGSANLQPTIVNNVLNGLPVVRFDGLIDGNGDYMDTPTLTGRTVFAVLNHNSATFTNWTTALGEQVDVIYVIQGRSGTTSLDQQWTGCPGNRYINGVLTPVVGNGYEFAPLATHKIVTVLFDSDNHLALRIGKDRTQNERCWQGDIAEIIIYDQPLNFSQQNQVVTYLSQKYALDASCVLPGQSCIWVKVPQISGTNTSIWAYWGNARQTNLPVYATNGLTWSNQYTSVWHLSEDQSETRYDSVLRYTGIPSNTVATAGRIGAGNAFNGSSAGIDTTYGQPSVTAYTVTAWVRTVEANGNRVLVNDRGSGSGSSLTLCLRTGNGKVSFGLDSSGVFIGQQDGTPAINDKSWHHLTGVWTAPSGAAIAPDQFSIYVDGAKASSSGTTQSSASSPLQGSGITRIAYHQPWTSYLNASLDEVRATTIPLSSNWIWACWMNQGSNSLFNSYGRVEKLQHGTVMSVR